MMENVAETPRVSNIISPKILHIDIETAPMLVYVFKIGENYITHEQIKEDSHLMSFCANWHNSDELIYMDNRNEPILKDDTKMLLKIWDLLDEADIVVGQNTQKFDGPYIQARFMIQKINNRFEPSEFRHIDLLKESRKKYKFISHSLAYKTNVLNEVYKKLTHSSFPGLKLWIECLNGNLLAWDEMEKYNKHDVLSAKEQYQIMKPHIKTINFDVYHKDHEIHCPCGKTDLAKNGFRNKNKGVYQKYYCRNCGEPFVDYWNELSQKKRQSMSSS